MKLVQAQINPHFLFNALNTVIAILRKDADRARELLLNLSTFFRKNLKREGDTATLEDEISHVNSYLVIEKARFEDRLTFEMDIDPDLLSVEVPVFTLQPLIENAIKHGVSNMMEPGVVKLSAQRDLDELRVTIEDNAGCYEEKSDGGLGMSIVEKRIKNICGEQYGLSVSCVPEEQTLVTIKLPGKRIE